MTIEQIKHNWKNGTISLLDAMSASREAGYNMTRLGKSQRTGMGGNWAWFKR